MGIVFSEQDFQKILDNRYDNYVNKKSLFSDVVRALDTINDENTPDNNTPYPPPPPPPPVPPPPASNILWRVEDGKYVFDKPVVFNENMFTKKDIACKGIYMGEMGGVNEVLASAKLYNPTIVSGPPNVQPNIKTFDGKRLLIDTNLDVSRSAAMHAGVVVVNPLKYTNGSEVLFQRYSGTQPNKTGILTLSSNSEPSGTIYSTTDGLYQNPYGQYPVVNPVSPKPVSWTPSSFSSFY